MEGECASSPRRKSHSLRTAVPVASRSVRDTRQIQNPTDVSLGALTRVRRFHIGSSDRPTTVDFESPSRLKKATEQRCVYVHSKASYFPQIHESPTAREFREHRAKYETSETSFWRRRSAPGSSSLTSSQRSQTKNMNDSKDSKLLECQRRPVQSEAGSVAMKLDRDGMESIFQAFQNSEALAEDEFITEMLLALKANTGPEGSRLELTGQLSELFSQADIHAQGVLTWEDFSSFFAQTSDVVSALEDTAVNKYQADSVPSPLNLAAEVQGMIYLPGADQILIHEARNKGFHLYDVSTHRLRSLNASKTAGSTTVDAVYTVQGRYIITASTSPVLTFYDVDHLQIRQQVPTQSLQTALALHNTTPSGATLYSSCYNGQVHQWNLQSLQCQHTFFEEMKNSAAITDLELLSSMNQLACGSMDGKIYMLDLVVGKVTKTMSGHSKGIAMLGYNADSKYLVSGGIDHNLQVWNPHLEQKVGSLPGHRHQLVGLEVRPNSPEIITADESGIIKIWDLRKFAAVQTIVRELYVKDQNSSAGRAMTAMCFIESKERIAIAHSSIFLLDPKRTTGAKPSLSDASHFKPSRYGEVEDDSPDDEDRRPYSVTYHPASHSFVAILSWIMVSWDANTGCHIRSTPIMLGSEVRCADVTEDQYSCFVGCLDGTVGRLMLPNAAVIVVRKLHPNVEVNAVKCIKSMRKLVSSAMDGTVVVSQWDTLDIIHTLSHWRGVQSFRLVFDGIKFDRDVDDVYSVPLHLRSYFIGNELERLKFAFAEVDPHHTGKIHLGLLPRALELAFPSISNGSTLPIRQEHGNHCTMTFAVFVETVKDAIEKRAWTRGTALAVFTAFDVHPEREQLVTTSSQDGSFCVWNLKNGAVSGEGSLPHKSTGCSSIAIVSYLSPLPYFVCVEENSVFLSVWACVAIPPLTQHSHQCLLRYEHSNALRVGSEFRSRASTMFLTEPKTVSTSVPKRRANEDAIIRAVDWYCNDRDDKKLICIGDDTGYVHILDFKSVLRRLDDVKKQGRLAVSHLPDERARHSLATLTAIDSTGSGELASKNQNELLPGTVLQRLHRWRAHQSRGVGVRSVKVSYVESLIQPNYNKRILVFSVGDNGLTQLWSVDGQLLGCLSNEADPRPALLSPWKLRLDVEELTQRSQESASSMLRQVDQRLSVSLNHESQIAGGSGALVLHSKVSQGLFQRPMETTTARPSPRTALIRSAVNTSTQGSAECALVRSRLAARHKSNVNPGH